MGKKMLSILTNFSCHWGCSYCVYRENGIKIPYTDTFQFGWDNLAKILELHKGEIISLSGGGDPLYEYEENNNKLFYIKLFNLLEEYNCTLELHTSIFDEKFPYYKCERVVFHLTMPTQISIINDRFFKLPKFVRAVYVVQEYYTKALITEITNNVNNSNNSINELSFRQMIDFDGKATNYLHDYLLESHMKNGKWYYIEQNDYNDYFVHDHIEKEYLNIK
ncbi:hypothetical protein [Clostridium tagluense]|uniref:Radical SAM core domain-containing protein n=1 Tax=Clostridium tagluense TaxID=360422 RepID=A0A401UQD9_9CLOT|nr:hypothetical protein [Clostridium tagluense]GCD11736.1 hypothetical protein Ctaglu_33590 [Clostridium tagluense]